MPCKALYCTYNTVEASCTAWRRRSLLAMSRVRGTERTMNMATEPAAETATQTATKLKLDPPEALQPVPTAEAAGLVPLKTEETSELDNRVAQFVDELSRLDSNSPEFGKKVDQLTAMGRKEIAEAAGAS